MVRSLRKQLKQARKAEHILDDLILDDVPIEVEEEHKNDGCPECGKGTLKVFVAPHATYCICDVCSFRNVTPNGEKK